MRKYITAIVSIAISGILFTCSSDKSEVLPSFDERVGEAKSSLKNDLIAPVNGWRLEYQPTPNSGIFLMLLKFE